MSFGGVIRYAASPSTNPSGLGGKANVIWHCDMSSDRVYELSISDLGVVRSANSPGSYPNGIGGTASKIWHCDSGECKVYELSTTDLGVVRSAAPTYYPDGIGGGSDVVWHLSWNEGYTVYRVHELSISDFSIVRSGSAPTEGCCKIGGNSNVIWVSSYDSERVYELSTTDFGVVRSVASPTNNPTGIGGDVDTLWYLHNLPYPPTEPDRVYELDAAASPPPTAPTDLMCNGQTNPVDVIPSYFSAIYHGGYTGKHYQVQVNKQSNFAGAMMWDSGKTSMSDVSDGQRCDNISYDGQALSLNKIKYYWRIKFWDSEGDASPWSSAANFTMAGSGVGEVGAGPWEEDVLEPTGEAKVEIPRRSGQWTTLDDVMRIHSNITKNPLDKLEIAQAEVICSNIDKHFNSFEEASSWYKSLEGYAVQLSVGCKVGGIPISRKLFTGIISAVDADRINQTAEIRVVDFLDYFGRVTIEQTPVWQNISLTQLYKNLVELTFPDWEEGVDYFVEDLGDITVEAIGYEKLNLLSELKHIAESRGKRIFTDVNGKLVCRSRDLEGEAWDIRNNYNLEDVRERRDIDNVFNWMVVHARPHEIKKDIDPPGKVGGFTATPGDAKIDLSWSNPTDDDFEKVRIQYSKTGYPPDRNDGTNIYEGTGESKSHTGLTNGQRYYYSAFTVDDVGNWSEAARASAVAGIGGGTWEDETLPSTVINFTAIPEHSKIVLSWNNPKLANFKITCIRYDHGPTAGYPGSPTEGDACYSGTLESHAHVNLKNGERYYYSAFVQNTDGRWSPARFASAIPAGVGDKGSLEEVTDTETISGGGCLGDQRDVPPDWIVYWGCFYWGTNGYSSKRLSFSKRGSASNWLKFKIEWDIYNWMSSGEPCPKHKSIRERRIGINEDLSLNFDQNCGIAQVSVSKISESSTGLSVQFKIVYTGPKRVGWHFEIKLTLEGRA